MPPTVPLPIDEVLPDLKAALRSGPNAVLIAPPGAGKTTRVPPSLIDEQWLGGGAIVMLQPRRVAARAAATRIAAEQQWRLGEEVGWHIRFDRRLGPRTRVRVLTEGILLRQIQADPFLEGVSAVLLDEFHERSLHTDLALALLREVQQSVRPELRIVVMSATLDPAPVQRFLCDAPLLESEGRLHPVTIEHRPRPAAREIPDAIAAAVREALDTAESGHVLAFLPGMGEIRRAAEALRGSIPPGTEIHLLHSSIPGDDQDRAVAPSARRKVVLATNIAETSLTIDGVRTVVDSGLERVLVSDPALGIDRLELQRISLASARQRAGRAGRTAPGRCIRLWTRAEELGMDDHAVPEVLRADMAATVLALKDYGAADPASFGWFQPPPPERLEAAVRLLQVLGAIDKTQGLTAKGRRMARLPVHPRLGALLLAGAEAGIAGEAAAIAAVLSEKDLFRAEGRPSERRPRWTGRSDVLDRAEALDGRDDSAVDVGALMAARRTRDALRRLVEDVRATHAPAEADRLKLLLHAYPDRVTLRRENDPARGLMVGRRGVVLDGASTVREGRLFLSIDPREAVTPQGTECRVALASAIEPEWLEEIHPQHLETTIACRFDPERERVLAERERRFLGLPYKVEGISPKQCEAEAAACFAAVIRDRIAELLAANEPLAGLVGRIRFLNRVLPEAGLPTATDEWLGVELAKAAHGCLSWAEFRDRDLAGLLLNQLDWSQRVKLDADAPSHLPVPTGNRIRLDYTSGDQPVLAVRLQELFGLAETPRLAGGRVPVLLHLLGPNYRPVQVTSDLRNFWNTTYAVVRKELRARYPKHAWPEDPWNAPPTARGGHRRRA